MFHIVASLTEIIILLSIGWYIGYKITLKIFRTIFGRKVTISYIDKNGVKTFRTIKVRNDDELAKILDKY